MTASPSIPAPDAPAPPPARDRFCRRPFRLSTWLGALFLLLSFPIGTFWFVVLVTGLSLGGGLVIVWVGVPILAATVVLWVAGAKAERWRVKMTFGTTIPSPYRAVPDGSFLRRNWRRLRDPAIWRDFVYLLLLFPIGIVEFCIAVTLISITVSAIAMPGYYWWVPGGVEVLQIDGEGSGIVVDSLPRAALFALGGLVCLFLSTAVLGGLAKAHLSLAQWLLGPSRQAELEERVETLTESRSRTVDAAMDERRRIERDLHDGAQQRLVSLAMELGMAKAKLDSDPAAARQLVESAHDQAKRALTEMRELVRGIHPAILTDRGLDAAISALAGSAPIPVFVDVQLSDRPSEAIETTAYFVVAEALANVAKHADANEAGVRVRREGGNLIVEIGDNGRGGASAAKGSGLRGLADRVGALDGTLEVSSPLGGPTIVRATFPEQV